MDISWLSTIIIGLLTTLVIYFVYRNFRARVLFKNLSDLYMQTLADKMLLEGKVKELYQDIENQKLQNSDGFVKFLSDSRDWAYQYIEDVQSELSNFDKNIAPTLEWANTYGLTTGSTAHTDALQKISEAYEQLKQVLPKDNQTPNN